MKLEQYKNKIQNYKPTTFSYFKENMKLLLNTYPQALENLGMWRKFVSQADLDPDQFKEIITKSFEVPLPYSRIGYVRNRLIERRKPKKKVIHSNPQTSLDLFHQWNYTIRVTESYTL